MNVVVVTNGNFFSYLALRQVLLPSDHISWHVVLTTGLRRPQRSRLSEARRLLAVWGWRYAAYKAATYGLPALASTFTRRPLAVRRLCRERRIPYEVARNVNDGDMAERMRALNPSLLVSYSCPYRLRSHVLAVARLGAVNVHSSLLPAYAGVCTYIHALANGETETGVTIHEMVEEFDAGRVLAQEPVAIVPGMSVARLFAHQSEVAGRLLRRVVEGSLDDGRVSGTPQDLGARTYFGEPTKADVCRLRRRGHRLLAPSDVRLFVTGRVSRQLQNELA